MKKIIRIYSKVFVPSVVGRSITTVLLSIILILTFVPVLSNNARSVLIGPDKAFAQVTTGVEIPGHGTTFADFNAYIKAVFDFSLKLGVALTVLMLIFAGYKYMTSQGNPTALNEAKDIMIGSLSGFIMLLLVYLILNVYNLKTP